ncbi:hypothetical protein PPTG_24329 [Phytophthora nicotianae INRA-310]|uniref:RxLR effector protein n=1 Tax=Phytophthora nicotianae (strain INRA-310) TaxID=761204 RepID=W2PHF5_PHYN3|nr:hypothetical protein PPTG_24329 [Phytophthora nicotianae INRA-310]ETN00086.1 hypothetical protein PPTG_24329 [Phytophthora nicotianae INRA-310]
MGLLYLVGLASFVANTTIDANSPIVTSSVGAPKVSNQSSYEVFNKKNPGHQASWIDSICFNYGWFEVKDAIKQAMKNPKSVNIAKEE